MTEIKCYFVEPTGNERCKEKKWCDTCQTYHELEKEFEYRRTDTGEIRWGHYHWYAFSEPGAMFFRNVVMEHEGVMYKGNGNWNNDDGRHLYVLTPGGLWDIDTRCSNCTLPQDRMHRCWVRHGDPPNITVNKNGLTCAAGGGSILQGDYHAMLENGILRDV